MISKFAPQNNFICYKNVDPIPEKNFTLRSYISTTPPVEQISKSFLISVKVLMIMRTINHSKNI